MSAPLVGRRPDRSYGFMSALNHRRAMKFVGQKLSDPFHYSKCPAGCHAAHACKATLHDTARPTAVPCGFAGAGLANIAAAKAGIMKEGRPVVLAHQPEPEAETHLLQHAALVQCPVTRAAQVVAVEPQGIAFAAGAWRQQVCISLADEADHSSLQWQNGERGLSAPA